MANTEKLQPRTLHNSLKGQGLAQLIMLASYLSDLTHKIIVFCLLQKLPICNISHPKFPCRIFEKLFMTKIKLLSVTSANFWCILIVTVFII